MDVVSAECGVLEEVRGLVVDLERVVVCEAIDVQEVVVVIHHEAQYKRLRNRSYGTR